MQLRTKLFLTSVICFAIVSTIGIVSYYYTTKKLIFKKWGEKLSAIAVHCSFLIDGDEHLKLTETKDMNSYVYNKIYTELTNIKKLYDNEVEFIYTMVKAPDDPLRGKGTFFVVDTDTGPTKVTIGYWAPADKDEADILGFERVSYNKDIIPTQYGPAFSGYAPIYDKLGHKVGAVGVDLRIDILFKELTQLKIRCVVLFFCSLLLFSLIYWLMFSKTFRLTNISELTLQKIVIPSFGLFSIRTKIILVTFIPIIIFVILVLGYIKPKVVSLIYSSVYKKVFSPEFLKRTEEFLYTGEKIPLKEYLCEYRELNKEIIAYIFITDYESKKIEQLHTFVPSLPEWVVELLANRPQKGGEFSMYPKLIKYKLPDQPDKIIKVRDIARAISDVGIVHFGVNNDYIQAELSSFIRPIVIIFFIVCILGSILVLIISTLLVKPLKLLTEQTYKISQGDLNTTIDYKSKDEIGVLAGAFNKMIEKLSEQNIIRETLEKYVPKEIAKKLLANPNLVEMCGERKELTILFADIQGFTKVIDETEPEELVIILNDYLSKMTEIIFKYGGTIDKFIGDQIFAFFGDPIYYEDHSIKAAKAAIEMYKEFEILTAKWKNLGYDFDIYLKVAIHRGFVTVGSIGSESLKDYTILGKNAILPVQMVFKIPSLGKILITEQLYRHLKDKVEVSDLGIIQLPELKESLHVFSLEKLKEEEKSNA